MTRNKPEPKKDKVWEQHLRWLDLVGHECRANQLKRERQKAKKRRD